MIASLYSFLMATLWSTLFILLLFLLRRSSRFLLAVGALPLVILGVCSLVRYFFPIEILSFTKVVENTGLFAKVNNVLVSPLPQLGISPLLLLSLVWILGFVLLFTRFWVRYALYLKRLKALIPIEEEDNLYVIAQEIAAADRISRFEIYLTDSVKTPTLVGFLYPRILLPEYPYSNQDYEYIFLHEFAHWKNRDLWFKLLTEFLCDFLWWNPAVYLLRKDSCQVQELRCDLAVTKDFSDEKLEGYVTTLMTTIRYRSKKECKTTDYFIVTELIDDNKEDVLQRTKLILFHKKRPLFNKIVTALTVVAMACLMVFSYSFVIQPQYHPTVEDYGTTEESIVDPENGYLIQNSSGAYYLYLDGAPPLEVTGAFLQSLLDSGFPIINEMDE